jgi:transcriptional regulator GlxA family with amidase domain
VAIVPDVSIRALARRRSSPDRLLVIGGPGAERAADDAELVLGIRRLSARCRHIGSVCTGAFVLAAAGLLDHHRATTHWSACDQLAAQYPSIEVIPDSIYINDRDRWTSAGVTAAIDLALALVEHDEGPEIAHAVARWLVVFVRRPGGQVQFSAQLRHQWARTPALVQLQRWLPDHLTDDLTVEALADRAGMSTRNFARAFRREVGSTPAALVEALRVEAARGLLETTDLTVHAVAHRVGIRHPETLHRAFLRHVGTTPDRYRQHFGRQTG